MAIVKKLTKLGSSSGIVIDKPVLELLNITPDTPLEITTDGKGLTIRPLSDDNARKFEKALAKGHQRYGKVFKRLADA